MKFVDTGAAREVDLGTILASNVANNGPQTLLSLASGEIAHSLKAYAGNVFCDADSGAAIGRLADIVAGNFNVLGLFDTDLIEAAFVDIDAADGALMAHRNMLLMGPADIVAAWTNSSVVDSSPVAWEALHAYAGGEWTIQPDVNNADAPGLWQVTTPGTSGASAPTWDSSGAVTDGSAEWTWQGNVPTVGSGRFSITVATPVAP